MAEVLEENYDSGSYSDELYHERLRTEPIYESFVCPLTKKIMRDPVAIESGLTFERKAIEKFFKECKESGRKPICPITLKELSSTELNSSIALRNTIEEWKQRNDSVMLGNACRTLTSGSSESDILHALSYVSTCCRQSRSNKNIVRNEEIIPNITAMLKNTSRKVRCKALETLRIVAEDDNSNKEIIAGGDTIRTLVKFLSHDHSQEIEEAVYLLYELSKHEVLCERIGGVSGAILILIGMSSSHSEHILTVERAEKTLDNLEKCENNVKQMAESGRLRPLLTLILEGSPETQLSMASYLGELVLSNDVKVFVAQTAGSALVNIMQRGSIEARESALKALNQISSYEPSAKILIQADILPPLVKDLFSVGSKQLPMRLKEVSANILANVVQSGTDFRSIPLDHNNQTLVSEEIVHSLLHLISNTGPSIACKLLQVLVGLTTSPSTVNDIVSAIISSGATISLIQFVEAPQRDLLVASIKLLNNISPYMGQELSDSLRANSGQLSSLVRVISEDNGISEEQAAAVNLLAVLPERDSVLTKRLLSEGAFDMIMSKLSKIRHGSTRGGRFVNPYLEGLVRVLSRITYILEDEPDTVSIAQDYNLALVFAGLLQMNGMDKVQMFSCMALENLFEQSKRLTRVPEPQEPAYCISIFPCFAKQQVVNGLCRLHNGFCSIKESFCILEGKVVEKLVACLDHANEKVVEASLAALCTLMEDGVDIEQGVFVLCEAEGIKPVIVVLLENRTEVLRSRAVWAIERILRTEEIALTISSDQNVGAALVEAYRHSDYRTKQIAERALRHVDRLPNFSGIYPTRMGR